VAAEVSMRVALALAFALALVVPTVAAHLGRDRPHIQAFEGARRVDFTRTGTTGEVKLLASDPLRDLVRHALDPARGLLEAEYRKDPSLASTALVARWTMSRIVEYRDSNDNGLFDPGIDPVSRTWRPAGYVWNATEPADVFIGGTTATAMTWNGTVANGPKASFILAAAGQPFRDEGARAQPQDVLVYFDMSGFPPRGVGHLYAIELELAPTTDAQVTIDLANVGNGTAEAGLRVETKDRLVALDWGAQATLDGREQFMNVTVDKPDKNGNRTVFWHFPRFDSSLHMVIVSGVEFVLPERTVLPDVSPGVALALVALLALARRKPRKDC
jgi:hypothetical protein